MRHQLFNRRCCPRHCLLTGLKRSLVSFGVLLIAAEVAAHEGHDHEPTKPAPDFSFDPADKQIDVTMLEGPMLYDGDITEHRGQIWYAWLEFVPGQGDLVWIGQRKGDDWTTKRQITSAHGEYAAPTLTSDRSGRLWLTYEARTGDQWDVYLVEIKDGKAASAPQPVSTGKGADIHHQIVATKQGLWIIWQTDRGGQFDVVGRPVVAGNLGEAEVIGDGPAGDWHPAVAADAEGNIHVAWDSYQNGSFDILLRSRRGGQWSEIVPVAASDAFEGRADVVTDQQDRVWIAWEEGGTNWGQPFRGINSELVSEHKGPLHRFRQIQLCVVENGKASRFDDPLPMPSIDAATRRKRGSKNLGRSGAFYERSRLAVDGAGRLWLVYRHYYTPWLTVAHRSHVEQGWGVYARCYTSDGWSPLFQMSIGQGDGLQRLELAPHKNGIAAVWTTGRTDRRQNARPRGLATAVFALPGNAPGTLPLAEIETSRTPAQQQDRQQRESVTVGGKTYYLFYGDLHRHTDLSLCRVPIDGTIDDAYRYAIEVARLDFLGVTDHSRDIAEGDPLSQLWWRSRKEVLRHQLVSDRKMKFIPFYAYERSHGNTADHNVISLRPNMLRPHTYPVPVFWKELDRDTMTIPHQPIRRDTWKYQNDLLRPLVEIFQGCRDNSIEKDVHRGLREGYHLGFIASSDHMATSSSYACVWAEEPTRESVFRAMQARRTFAATDKIWLTLHTGDHWMGEILPAEEAPVLTLRAKGTAPVDEVHLIVDGQAKQTWTPKQAEVELTAQLDGEKAHYAYFHLIQSDGNEAWSSPIWLQQDGSAPEGKK